MTEYAEDDVADLNSSEHSGSTGVECNCEVGILSPHGSQLLSDTQRDRDRETETETDRDRGRERQRHREMGGGGGTDTETEKQRQTDRQRQRQRERDTDRHKQTKREEMLQQAILRLGHCDTQRGKRREGKGLHLHCFGKIS